MSTYLLIRMDFPSGCSLGPGRTAILEGIDRFGSISGASRVVGLTYRQVWNAVKLLNESFPSPLVDIRAGGRASGASLTPLGKDVVARYRAMEEEARQCLARHVAGFEALLGEDPQAPMPVPRWAQSPNDPTVVTAKGDSVDG